MPSLDGIDEPMSDFLFGLMIANDGMRAGTESGVLAASHVVAALVVLGYGVAGIVRV